MLINEFLYAKVSEFLDLFPSEAWQGSVESVQFSDVPGDGWPVFSVLIIDDNLGLS